MKEKIEKNNNINIKKIESNLKKYVDDKIKSELEKTNKKLIREKSKKILYRNIIILILIIIILFLLYLLKSVHYFDKFFIEKVNSNTIQEEKETKSENDEESLEQLIDKYGYLLENIYINEKSEYLNDYYDGNITNELKMYICFNSIDLDKYIENNYLLIDSSVLKSECNKIFNEYNNNDFKFNGNTIKYISKLDSFFSDNTISNNKTNIKREIINIDTNNTVSITAIEGLVKDGKVYNIVTNQEIGKFNGNLLIYKNKLNIVTYKFDNDKLTSIKVN